MFTRDSQVKKPKEFYGKINTQHKSQIKKGDQMMQQELLKLQSI